jgi:hypothetical protein
MGVVVSARHVQLGQRVALKFLLAPACEDPDAVARFLREAQAAVQIRSEHVARILDVGTLEGGAPYMVMEFLSGSDLGRVLDERGALPVDEALGYVLQACEALAEAHACGIVHRDLKPSNLFLAHRADGSPLVKVLDFGISKATGTTMGGGPAAAITATAMVMGSPAYMSPEQVRSSKHVDARTDIWALGVVLHQLVSGRLPFEGTSMTEIMAMIVADPPTPLRRARPTAPAPLEKVILGCLEKDPRKRVANVADLARALAPFAPPAAQVSVERIARVLGQASGQASGQAVGSGTMMAPDGTMTPYSSGTGPGGAASAPYGGGMAPQGTLMAPDGTAMAPSSPGAGGLRDNTDSAWGATGGPVRPRRPRALLIAGAASVAALVGAGAFFGLRGAPASSASAQPASVQTAGAQTAGAQTAGAQTASGPTTSAATATSPTSAITPTAAIATAAIATAHVVDTVGLGNDRDAAAGPAATSTVEGSSTAPRLPVVNRAPGAPAPRVRPAGPARPTGADDMFNDTK